MGSLKMAIMSHNARLGIDNSKLNRFQWTGKFMEEVKEVINARNRDNDLEECFDVMQMLINKIAFNYTKQEIEEGLRLHNEKLNSRGWEVKEEFVISFKGE